MAKVGKSKSGDCWTITFENVSQRALGRPDNVWTWGGIVGNTDELIEAIETTGGTFEIHTIYNESGLEITDIKNVEICVPCENFASPPSDTLQWSFLNGSRTSNWSKKNCAKKTYTEPRHIHARVGCIGLDNGFTAGSSSNTAGTRPNLINRIWPFESKGIEINDAIVGAGQLIGPAPDWTAQFTDDSADAGKAGTNLERWVPYLNSVLPQNGKYCAAFGRETAPTWRYTKITTIDPCARFGQWNLCRTDLAAPANQYTVFPAPSLTRERIVQRWFCWEISEGKKKALWFEEVDGELVESTQPTWQPHEGADPEPIPLSCFIPCDQKFEPLVAEDAQSPCQEKEFQLCDEAGVEYIRFLIDCDGTRERFTYTLNSFVNAESSDDLVDGPPGALLDCETGEAFVEPEIEVDPMQQMIEKQCETNELLQQLIDQGPETVNVDKDFSLDDDAADEAG